MRLEVFKKNFEFIENFNSKANQSYKLGVNEFTDRTKEEFPATHTGLTRRINVTSSSQAVDNTMSSWNWNVSNIVGQSKDWRMEGLTKIAGGNLISLSEQQLIDCDGEPNEGCRGGTMEEAFTYIAKNGGISSEDAYPYQERDGTCQSQAEPAMQIRGFQYVPRNNERALLEAVSMQPVSVSRIAGLAESFSHYSSGVYSDPACGIATTHAVTLVGYGTSPERIKYWLAKNSWGETWGENGYIRLRRDVEWPQGMCGLAQYVKMVLRVSYVLVVLTILSMDHRISQATSRVAFQKLSIADYFEQWMIQFSRVYVNSLEKQMRLEVFEKNLEYIENFNTKENKSYKLGVDEFTDQTDEEFLATHTGLSGISAISSSEVVDESMSSWKWNVSNIIGFYATSKDWRLEGAVTPVKNQRIGCWAFSAIAAVEGLTKISQGKLVSLSEQQLLDCDKANHGCKGGLMDKAFNYIAQKGITGDDDYPFLEEDGICQFEDEPVIKIRGYQCVPRNNELALREAVSRQPVSVGVAWHLDSIIHYSSGVYDEPYCGINMNHAVTIVGYGTSPEGKDYWLAKNSWGASWGENGYVRLRRDVEWREGMCGLAQYACYPVV
ncbi:LOW QUALITY PROTEIN: hypothetical protein HID58_083637 [Brassica napus]|uniref:Uncharacterized protein n=2 Tax=Brassica TaxID=3705 RepID=A0ABQ7YGT6_BRANA|nr:LOW QUALITY PROTEIN: hypothetical protein HID58_083637 [Brassica napus]